MTRRARRLNSASLPYARDRAVGAALTGVADREAARPREEQVAWRSSFVHDCPLCGAVVRPARTAAGRVLLLGSDGGEHPIICTSGGAA